MSWTLVRNASSLATVTAAPPGPAAAKPASGATKTATIRARWRRARPAAYQPARMDVVVSSTPTRMTDGPSVPSSNDDEDSLSAEVMRPHWCPYRHSVEELGRAHSGMI